MQNTNESKLITLYDYQDVDFSKYCIAFEVDEDDIQEGYTSLSKKYASLLPVESIELGDIAHLKCTSELKKFNKDAITISVGKNLYHKDLEKAVLGKRVGDVTQLNIQDHSVIVEVLKIERSTPAELNDDFLQANLKTVHTMDELRAWYVNQQLENHILNQASEAAEMIIDTVIEKSHIVISDEDKNKARIQAKSILDQQWEFNGIVLDNMSDQEAQEILGYPNVQEYIEWFGDLMVRDLYCTLIGKELYEKNGMVLSVENYEKALKQMSEEENVKEDELRQVYTYQGYVNQTCSEYLTKLIQDYAYGYIKERV